jgi:hypothetical protein
MCCKVIPPRHLKTNGIDMFKLLRFYSVTSFIIIFLTAALLTLFYRQVTMHWIEHLAKNNNLAVAQTALNFVGPELATYLGSAPDSGEREIGSHALPADLAARIRRVMQDTTVSRIEIYNRNGRLIFSTHATPTAPPLPAIQVFWRPSAARFPAP